MAQTEHFVTLFDNKFLIQGIALYKSLINHCPQAHLWIICIDETVEQNLARLNFESVTLVPVASIENESLLKVKNERSHGEYCWTLTAFIFEAVLGRDDTVNRLTYLDADLCFFDNPMILLDELTNSGKSVLITEHAFAPAYKKWEKIAGRFVVQFVTFSRTADALKILQLWQEQSLSWKPGVRKHFSDQWFMNDWPERFPESVHILKQVEKALAPWNVSYYMLKYQESIPVFFHFHQTRVIDIACIRVYSAYFISKRAFNYYKKYVAYIFSIAEICKSASCEMQFISFASRWWLWIETVYMVIHRRKLKYFYNYSEK